VLDEVSENASEWRAVIYVIDRLLFWISLITLVIVAVWMIAISTRSPGHVTHTH